LPSTVRNAAGRLAILSALLLAGTGISAAQNFKLVKDVRFVSLGDTTRVVVDLSGEVEFRDERIEGPDRVFIDLRGAQPRRNGIAITVGDQALKRIRMGENQPGVTRLVFDIESPDVRYKVTRLGNPDRLIIEFARTAADRLMITPARDLLADRQPASNTPASTVVPPMPDVEPETTIEYPPFVPPQREAPKPRRAVVLVAEPKANVAHGRGVPPQSESLLAHNRFPSTPPAPPVQAPPVQAPPAPVQVQVAKTTPTAERPAAAVIVAKKPDEPYSYKPRDTRKGPYPTEPAQPGTAKPDGSMIRALGLKIGRIVIDPGHGGQDFGATGPTGLVEKEVTLDVSMRLAEMLTKRLGAEVVLLRDGDTAISPERRTEMANEAKADLFLSIHANSSSVPAATGIETFYLSVASTNGASDVAARENASSQRTMHEMQGLLEKIALNTKVNESREFAARVQRSLVDSLKGLDRGVKRAPFIVLIGAEMPAILAEVGFISNPKDEARMKQPAERQKIADSLFKGIASYAASLGQYEVAQRTE
jgi:N-acetylmuramoyl-L-alanine amidase